MIFTKRNYKEYIMSKTNSITECLSQLIELTKKNLNILNTINDSFYTKKEHLTTNIDGVNYVIPSFLSLENKIDTLQANLDNILNAPLTGEAYTYLDGATQKIELSGFQTSPNKIDLSAITTFNKKDNSIFKDFLSPVPYIRLDLTSIANNIKTVNVKKYTFKEDLGNILKDRIKSSTVSYSDLIKYLDIYTDYSVYDTVYRLPLRNTIKNGTYTIQSIKNNYTDSNFDEYYELVLDKLTYFVNNDTIEKDMQVGDQLVTSNDKCLLEITDLNTANNTIKVRIKYGSYCNLTDINSGNSDLYTLKYYKELDYNKNKYIEVPLEEDRFICLFVSAINDTTNTQSPFGTGLFIDTNSLTCQIDGQLVNFKDYYDNYVNNIGDSLYSITKILSSDTSLEKLSKTEFESLISKPDPINAELITVTQINKHLDDSDTIKNIKQLYNQKSQYKQELTECNNNIYNIQQQLINVSYDESNSIRTTYQQQLDNFNTQRTQLESNILSISNNIANYSNSADTPIENAKYRIRGFIKLDDTNKPIKIIVEYRYKNRNKFIGNAETIGEYIFSDWNIMDSIYRKRVPTYNNSFEYKWEDLNESVNDVSFNQIDIPITQGESVDIRYRVVYSCGYPLVETMSAWSDIYNIEFPTELVKDIDVLDIIEENNNDINKSTITSVLENNGYTAHKNDLLQDQDNIYYHQPEHISSGFYTDEKRVISLKDKLEEVVNSIYELQSDVFGATSNNLVVTVSDNNNRSISLKPNMVNTFVTTNYNDNDNKIRFVNNGEEYAYEQLTLTFNNIGNYNMKIHTMFPGDNNSNLAKSNNIFKIDSYTCNNSGVVASDAGIFIQTDNPITTKNSTGKTTSINYALQRYNQWIYFKTIDDDYGIALYNKNYTTLDNTRLDLPEYTLLSTASNITALLTEEPKGIGQLPSNVKSYSSLYPYLGNISELLIDNNSTYITIQPGESVSIPLSWYYWITDTGVASENNISRVLNTSKLIEFDIRTSLFRDPTTYKLVVKSYRDNNLGTNRTAGNNITRTYQIQTPNILNKVKVLR